MPVRVMDHPLEVGALVSPSRHGSINVGPDDPVAVCGGKGFTFTDLAFD